MTYFIKILNLVNTSHNQMTNLLNILYHFPPFFFFFCFPPCGFCFLGPAALAEGVVVADRLPEGGVGAPGCGDPTSLLLAEEGLAASLQQQQKVRLCRTEGCPCNTY